VKKNYLISFGVVLLVLIIDQVIKLWVKTSFSYDDPSIDLIGGWFKLNYVENQGMAFGATLGGGIWGKLILSVFRVVAIVSHYLLPHQTNKNWSKERIYRCYFLGIGRGNR